MIDVVSLNLQLFTQTRKSLKGCKCKHNALVVRTVNIILKDTVILNGYAEYQTEKILGDHKIQHFNDL